MHSRFSLSFLKQPNGKNTLKIDGFLAVWMYACRNILRFTMFCNIEQSEITFKIIIMKLGLGKNRFYSVNTIKKNDLGRSWGGDHVYIYMYIFYVAPSKHDG